MKLTAKKRGKKYSRSQGVYLRLLDENGQLLVKCQKREKLLSKCAQCTEKQWLKGLVVSVVYQKDVTNSGTFHNKTSIQNSLREWLEPDLVKYCTEGAW